MIDNPIITALKNHRILLASGSPRRQEYLTSMGIPFTVVENNVEETYPEQLIGAGISDYLACLKADAFKEKLEASDILITADTVVWHEGSSLGKPASAEEAISMLQALSNSWHEVITSVCFTTREEQQVVNCTTQVRFRALELDEIRYYARQFRPLDKAGAYGIQEWLGMVGIEEIRGSYANVVGLPTHIVYKTLRAMVR